MEVCLIGKAMKGMEREVKIRISSIDSLEERISSIGAMPAQDRKLEDNIVLDFRDFRLTREGKLIRLRRYGEERTLTYKGPASFSGNVKTRDEIEVALGSMESALQILSGLGLRVIFRYQKYRRVFQYHELPSGACPEETGASEKRKLHIMVDETPIGNFLELEGDEDLILKTAQLLGYTRECFIPSSYRELYADYCRERGQAPGDMVF